MSRSILTGEPNGSPQPRCPVTPGQRVTERHEWGNARKWHRSPHWRGSYKQTLRDHRPRRNQLAHDDLS